MLGDDIIRWMKEFIESGELEESNINDICLCLYDFLLFPCKCACLSFCCKKRNIKNEKNK